MKPVRTIAVLADCFTSHIVPGLYGMLMAKALQYRPKRHGTKTAALEIRST